MPARLPQAPIGEHAALTLRQSCLRRWLKSRARKGVGSSPAGVTRGVSTQLPPSTHKFARIHGVCPVLRERNRDVTGCGKATSS